MGWFRVADGRLAYRGRITREPFTRWTTTAAGTAAVARVAAGIRFSLMGRSRSARRSLWRGLAQVARDEWFIAAMASEAGRYMQTLASLAYADALPRAHVALHRLVLVPRALIAGRARTALFHRLDSSPALAGLADDVRGFLFDQLLIEMDAALQQASPSPRRPVYAHDEWACVGVSKGLVWVDPLWAGSDGTGHVFMFELPRAGLPRRERQALEAAIDGLVSKVSTLSRADRVSLVRAASAR